MCVAPSLTRSSATGSDATPKLSVPGTRRRLRARSPAKLHSVTVPGQNSAIERICRWLDRIQHDHRGTHWPRWTTDTTTVHRPPGTPSWCYGTPGIARAQQLAALALSDDRRKRMAEHALLYCLADPHQLGMLTGRGLCHGVGGLIRVVQRVAQDAEKPADFTNFLPQLSERFLVAGPPAEAGFLEGATGASLAFQDIEASAAQSSDWDACLLLV
ncbi:lanthionine synthetase LanC family protein [Streptomyces sp. NPDC000880]